jgi:hypothetical protein
MVFNAMPYARDCPNPDYYGICNEQSIEEIKIKKGWNEYKVSVDETLFSSKRDFNCL